MGDGSSCGRDSVADCAHQACCWSTGIPGDDPVCDNLSPAACSNVGGESLGRGIRCEHIADLGCGRGGVRLSCCLADGSRLENVIPEYCQAANGSPVVPSEICPPPTVGEDCREPEPDREVGPAWTLDLCARAPLGPAIVADQIENHRRGYGILRTLRGVRNDHHAQPCGIAATTLFLDSAGYGSAVFCSRQERNPGWRAHEGTLAIQPAGSADLLTRPGYGVYVAAYNAPDWSETIVGSRLLRCTGAPV